MGRAAFALLAAVVACAGASPASAQRRRVLEVPARGSAQTRSNGVFGLPTTRLRPSDDGIIHWNTPNKDGNLGGPGAGGGGGGGG